SASVNAPSGRRAPGSSTPGRRRVSTVASGRRGAYASGRAAHAELVAACAWTAPRVRRLPGDHGFAVPALGENRAVGVRARSQTGPHVTCDRRGGHGLFDLI